MTGIKMFENGPSIGQGKDGYPTLLLAHGAGAPADSDFMVRMAQALASEGVATVRFEFPYMQRRRVDGRKRPPDRQPVLLEHFREALQQVASRSGGRVFIGGKSMGGRVASLLATEPHLKNSIAGCVCFGYPFHPPGKPERWRVDHFGQFCCPVLIIQGTRDPFGKQQELAARPLPSEALCRVQWLEGCNHDFKPLAKQAETQAGMIEEAARAAAEFMRA